MSFVGPLGGRPHIPSISSKVIDSRALGGLGTPESSEFSVFSSSLKLMCSLVSGMARSDCGVCGDWRLESGLSTLPDLLASLMGSMLWMLPRVWLLAFESREPADFRFESLSTGSEMVMLSSSCGWGVAGAELEVISMAISYDGGVALISAGKGHTVLGGHWC